MLDRSFLDGLLKESRTLNVGKDIPPIEPDEQRRINGAELSNWLAEQGRPAEDGKPVELQIWLSGFDIVGNFNHPLPQGERGYSQS